MIDTHGLADGTDILYTTVDPDNTLLESDDTNTCGSVLIQLSALPTSQPRAELRDPGPACGPGPSPAS